MTSQTCERRIRGPLDEKIMQEGAAVALFAMALCVVFQSFSAQAATPSRHYAAATEAERLIETGKATWYGLHHSHHYTVSGERFDPSQLTAAHRSLPIGAMVRVTDRQTGRSVVVRVNDREPPHGARCIDLSEGAATALGIRSQGVANVTISAVVPGDAVEVAEAPDDALQQPAAPARLAASAPHGRRHKRRAGP